MLYKWNLGNIMKVSVLVLIYGVASVSSAYSLSSELVFRNYKMLILNSGIFANHDIVCYLLGEMWK